MLDLQTYKLKWRILLFILLFAMYDAVFFSMLIFIFYLADSCLYGQVGLSWACQFLPKGGVVEVYFALLLLGPACFALMMVILGVNKIISIILFVLLLTIQFQLIRFDTYVYHSIFGYHPAINAQPDN